MNPETPYARATALEDTRLSAIPENCPFTPDQVFSTDFWPEHAIL